MTFDILDRRVVATTDQELFDAIHSTWMPNASPEDFKQEMSRKAGDIQSVQLRTDTDKDFLADLQIHGLLKTVEDPWKWFVMDEIKLGLFGPTAPNGWRHEFIWSNELPQIASISTAGGMAIRPVRISELPQPGFQQQWLREHLVELHKLDSHIN